MTICMCLAQGIIWKQFPLIDGWQSTVLTQINGFMPVTNDSIQIHHVMEITSCMDDIK